jgi:CHASE3 domain sensor protein
MPRLHFHFDWRPVPLLVLVILAASVSVAYHRLLLAQRDLIEHTYQVISLLETTLQRITDAETGQRGCILTGDQSYLAPYRQARSEIPTLPAQLRELVKDSTPQLQRVRSLEEALTAKMTELEATLQRSDQGGIDSVKPLITSNAGRDQMDLIRSIITEMRRAETDLLVQRTLQAKRTERHMLLVTFACALASFAARFVLYMRMQPRH